MFHLLEQVLFGPDSVSAAAQPVVYHQYPHNKERRWWTLQSKQRSGFTWRYAEDTEGHLLCAWRCTCHFTEQRQWSEAQLVRCKCIKAALMCRCEWDFSTLERMCKWCRWDKPAHCAVVVFQWAVPGVHYDSVTWETSVTSVPHTVHPPCSSDLSFWWSGGFVWVTCTYFGAGTDRDYCNLYSSEIELEARPCGS